MTAPRSKLWKNIFTKYMKSREKKPSNVTFVTKVTKGQFKGTHCWDSWREENIWCHLCKHSCSQKQTLRKYISEVHELKKPLKCDQSFSKMGNLTTEKAQKFMKERSHSNVTFVTTVFLKMAVWKYTFYQSVMEIKHSNVTFVTTVFPKRVI